MNVQNIVDRDKCCGCELCSAICPHKSVKFEKDEEGFVYPVVEEDTCMKCSACINHCPVQSIDKDICKTIKYYAAYAKDSEILYSSSSGGIASLLMEEYVKKGHYVAGVQYDADFKGAHYAITNEREHLLAFRGTKYIQSRKLNIYKDTLNILKQGKKVLFTGLPCEIAALKSYTKKYDEQLITVELICHGATSPDVAAQFIDNITRQYGKTIEKFNVRYKRYGWVPPCMRIEFSDGKVFTELFDSTAYGFAFRKISRKSCYNCTFKGEKSRADLTIGDYWGVSENELIWNSDGVSVILIHTEKGEKIIEEIGSLVKQEISREDALKQNPCIEIPRADSGREEYAAVFVKQGIFSGRKLTEDAKSKIVTRLRNYYYKWFVNKKR